MARDLRYIHIVDLEATCWQGEPPPGEVQEVIEIGLVRLDLRDGTVSEPLGELCCRPTESHVSPFCTQLTTLTEEKLSSHNTFNQTIDRIHGLKLQDATWASWGDFDRNLLERQCSRRGLRMPFGKTHLNVKNLFSLCYGLDREIGVGVALKQIGVPFKGTPHRGLDDAHNITVLLKRLLRP